MRKAIIHAGTEKTGSTYLQSCFMKSRGALKKHGILYPSSGIESGHHFWLAKGLGFRYRAKPLDPAREQKELESFRKEIRDWQGDILLSSEHFDFNFNAQTLQNLVSALEGYEPHIVFFFRNQVDYIQSLYLEGLKWNAIRTYSEFIAKVREQGRLSYLGRYEIMERLGVKSSIIDYDVHKRDITAAFIAAAGLPDCLETPERKTSNESISIDFLDMIRICNRNTPFDKRHNLFAKGLGFIKKNAPEFLEKRNFPIPQEHWEGFLQAEAENRELARKLGMDEAGFLLGGLAAKLEEHSKFPPPDATVAVEKLVPLLLK